MRVLYLDVSAGAAGDMLAGALLALLPGVEQMAFLETMNNLGLPGVVVEAEATRQCGITGTHFHVRVDGAEEAPGGPDGHGDHHHAGMADIEAAVAATGMSHDAAADVLAVYAAIAAAESQVHGVDVSELHFHELGTMDALADITAVALLLRSLAVEQIVASPVAVGRGSVRTAHGVLPVPAPATANLLRGIPCTAGAGEGELCTPTGAALLGHFATHFGPLPPMTPEAMGYGFGTKTFPDHPNCVRAILGTVPAEGGAAESIAQLQCNLDDMTAEDIAFAIERLYASGAVEVFTTPCGMKKSRPGVLLTALCPEERRGDVLSAMLIHTSTLGVRSSLLDRYVLDRTVETVDTALGPVRRKYAAGFGLKKAKWEYEDLAKLAEARGTTLAEIRRELDNGIGG